MRTTLPLTVARRLAIAVALVVVNASCADKASRNADLGNAPEPSYAAFPLTEVSGTVLNADTSFGRLGPLATSGATLWVADWTGAPWLHVLDRRDGHLIRSLGGRGSGPGQFQSVYNLSTGPTPNAVWVFDDQARRVTLMDTSIASINAPATVRLQVPGVMTHLIALGSNSFFGLQFEGPDSAHVMILSADGRPTSIAPWPLLGADSVPRWERIQASGAALGAGLCADPGGHHVALAYAAAGRIDIFSSTGARLRAADVPFPSEPVFTRNRNGQLWAMRPRVWYRFCAATATQIYALFSGRLESAFSVDQLLDATHVHVFDWNGRLLRVLHLDRPIYGMAVDAKGRTLYGASANTSTVYRFALP